MTRLLRPSRRTVLQTGLAGSAAALALGPAGLARAQAKEVKVALIAPLSGPWARQGALMKMGADLAIKHINDEGGIKSLGGAKMTLAVLDAGDSAEKAKNAAQRLVSSETDVVAGVGSWLSSFTLAITEVMIAPRQSGPNNSSPAIANATGIATEPRLTRAGGTVGSLQVSTAPRSGRRSPSATIATMISRNGRPSRAP